MANRSGGWLRRSALVLLAVGLGLLAAPPVAGAPPQDAAQDLFGYSGTAAADGLRASVLADDYILVDRPVDAGAPTAQAQLDSSGTSVGYAALPDPGELVRVAPGLAASLLGGVAVPAYPLIAASSDPGVPHAELSTVSYRLEATSSATSSEASAATGAALGEPAVGQVKGEASVTLDPDLRKLTSSATASVDVVSVLGGLLRIGRVESRASASQAVGGALERSSEFKVEGASILGQSIKINDDGIVLAGQTIPLPLAGSVLVGRLEGRRHRPATPPAGRDRGRRRVRGARAHDRPEPAELRRAGPHHAGPGPHERVRDGADDEEDPDAGAGSCRRAPSRSTSARPSPRSTPACSASRPSLGPGAAAPHPRPPPRRPRSPRSKTPPSSASTSSWLPVPSWPWAAASCSVSWL